MPVASYTSFSTGLRHSCTTYLSGHTLTMADDSNNSEVDQLSTALREQARIDSQEVVQKTIEQQPDTYDKAAFLHNAQYFTNACGGSVPECLDYGLTLDMPELTGLKKAGLVRFSQTDSRIQTIEDRIKDYAELRPEWGPEMHEAAARIDFENRPCEKGKWKVVRTNKELKKLQRVEKLKQKRQEKKKGKGKAKA